MEGKISKVKKKKKKKEYEREIYFLWNFIISNFIEFHGLNFVTFVIRYRLINSRDCHQGEFPSYDAKEVSYSSRDKKEKDVTAILTVSWAPKDGSGAGSKKVGELSYLHISSSYRQI